MELQHCGFYALHKWQNLEIRSPTKSSYNISSDVQPGGRLVLTTDSRSTSQSFGSPLVGYAPLKAPMMAKPFWCFLLFALYIYIYHCLTHIYIYISCGVEKSLRTTNETVFPAHINLSVGSAFQNTLCTADNATKAETAAVQRLSIYSI